MKTAISIPDRIFEAAERVCKRHQIPRSRFYTAAIKRLLEDYREQDVTEKLNQVYKDRVSTVAPELYAAQLRTLVEEQW